MSSLSRWQDGHCSWFDHLGGLVQLDCSEWSCAFSRDVQVRELSAEERDQQAQIRLRKHAQIFQHISPVFAAFLSRIF